MTDTITPTAAATPPAPLPVAITDYLAANLDNTRPHLEGWCTPEKASAMCRLILDTRPQVVVEIGVFGGRSLIPQALALSIASPGALLLGIDPWDTDTSVEGSLDPINDKWWRESVDLSAIQRGCLDAIRAANLQRHVAILPFHAHAIAPVMARPSIDILHIDGCHSELASTRDVRDWLPIVRRQGHVWFDDCSWASTQRAVALLDKACDRVLQVGDCVLFKKR